MKISKKEKRFLLNLSRKALTHIFRTGKELQPNISNIPKNLQEEMATFVTLNKNGELRGCIGKLLPVKPLYKDIIGNTYSAAFSDPRFPQLTRNELKDISIEISVLDKPQKLKYKDADDLVKKLKKDKPGVLIQHGFYSATFLPQVWEELKTPKEFLSHLCLKAGLSQDLWKQEHLNIQTYNVVKFSEKE